MKAVIQSMVRLGISTMTVTVLALTGNAFGQASACTHYASPTGSGSSCTLGSPCLIASFWSIARPGNVLCLNNGVYTGGSSMIEPTISGQSGNPITVRALNDGGARINGQGSNRPVFLSNVQWLILEGFDAHGSNQEVVAISTGGHNNIIRRVCAWDGNTNDNRHVWQIRNGATNNLLEDVCGFGTGRKIFEAYATDGPNTIRRAWSQWNAHALYGNDGGAPKHAFTATYHSRNLIIENPIGTWNGSAAGAEMSLFGTDRIDSGSYCVNSKYLGGIGYVRNADTVPGLIGLIYGSSNPQCFEFKDMVVYTEQSRRPVYAATSVASCSPNCNRRLTNITEIGTTASSIDTGANGWIVTNRVDVDTVPQAPNIWNGSGTQGARVCKQYVNGTLTSTPLWPWPMDGRIRAALSAAGKNPDATFGGAGNSVTQLMEQKFGAIPAECRTGGGSQLAAPTNLVAMP
jgi:hypothetical protein